MVGACLGGACIAATVAGEVGAGGGFVVVGAGVGTAIATAVEIEAEAVAVVETAVVPEVGVSIAHCWMARVRMRSRDGEDSA